MGKWFTSRAEVTISGQVLGASLLDWVGFWQKEAAWSVGFHKLYVNAPAWIVYTGIPYLEWQARWNASQISGTYFRRPSAGKERGRP